MADCTSDNKAYVRRGVVQSLVHESVVIGLAVLLTYIYYSPDTLRYLMVVL